MLKISGFADYSEQENRLFCSWKTMLEETYRLFGFMPFHARPVETLSALQSKGGIANQVYTLSRLQDGSQTDLALPFDRTIPLAIYIAAHRGELVYPFKRYDISHSFRGERAQAGRFRGFIQADLDVVGEHLSPLSEEECLLAMVTALHKLQIPPYTLYLNDIEIPKTLIQHMGVLPEHMSEALRIIDKMDKIGEKGVQNELLQALPPIDLSLLPLLAYKGKIEDFPFSLPPELQPRLKRLSELQEKLPSLALAFAPGMVRGLDYYTGLIFETTLTEFPHLGSIASGGRYNKLIDSFVQKPTHLEGFGISIGLTRIFDLLKKESLLPATAPPDALVAVVYRDASLCPYARQAAEELRKNGIATDLFLGTGPLGKQLTYASRKQIPYAFLVMGEANFVIKNLLTGEQTPDYLQIEEAVSYLQKNM